MCVHMHMYVLVHICGISEDSLQEWVLSYHVHPWDPAPGSGQLPLPSQPSCQLLMCCRFSSLPSSILSGKIISDQKAAFWEFVYTRNKQTPTLATMFQVVCRSLYSNFSLLPYEMGQSHTCILDAAFSPLRVKELNAGRLKGTMNVRVRTRKGQMRLEMEGHRSQCVIQS